MPPSKIVLPLRRGRDRDVAHGLDGDAGGVRRRDDVVQVQQRVVLPRRLLVENIEARARDAAADECDRAAPPRRARARARW